MSGMADPTKDDTQSFKGVLEHTAQFRPSTQPFADLFAHLGIATYQKFFDSFESACPFSVPDMKNVNVGAIVQALKDKMEPFNDEEVAACLSGAQCASHGHGRARGHVC